MRKSSAVDPERKRDHREASMNFVIGFELGPVNPTRFVVLAIRNVIAALPLGRTVRGAHHSRYG